MASNGTDILIRILTAYEAGGMEAAKRAAEDLAQSVDTSTDAGKTLAGVQELMNSKGNDAQKIFRGLSGVMRGGAGAVSGFSSAIQGIGSAIGIATGPLSLLSGAIMLGVTAWQKYQDEQRKALEETAAKAQAAAEEAKKHLEELDKTRLDAAKSAAEGLKESLKAAADEATRTRKEMDELDDAETARDLARIDMQEAKGELTSDEATMKRAEIRSDAADRKAEREAAVLDAEEKRLADTYAAAADEAGKATQTLADAEKALADAHDELAAAQKAQNRPGMGWIAAGEAAERVKNAKTGVRTARAAEEEAKTLAIAAKAREEEAAAQQAAAMPGIEHKRTLLAINQEARGYGREEALATYEKQSAERIERENAALKKAKEDASQKKRQDAIDRDKGRTVDERIAYAQGFVQNAQAVGGEVYRGGQSGAETKARANAAIEAAGREIAAGGDDLAVIQKLVSALEQMGAVVSNYRTLISQLDKMDGKIDHVASQFQNSRS